MEAVGFAEQFHYSESHGSPLKQPSHCPTGEAGPPRKARILIADDNEVNALALEDYLRALGYELYYAADGEQALARAEETAPDLILMDIQMPKLSGVEVMRRLRSNPRFASTPIVALTALAMPGDRELCLAAGASAYLAKPFLLKDLVRVVEEWLGRKPAHGG